MSAAQCFVSKPRDTNRGPGATVDPKLPVCRVFDEALNSTCGRSIPIVELVLDHGNTAIKLPIWQEIPLFDANGKEIEESFELLKTLVTARAITSYYSDPEPLAVRDLSNILKRIHEARAHGNTPRFEKTSIDLVGHGRPETLYRLYSGLLSNPKVFDKDPARIYGKLEPQLFLDRAIGMERRASSVQGDIVGRAGGWVTLSPSDVFVVNGVPYLVSWSGERAVLVYAAFGLRNRQLRPEESANSPSIYPQLQCVFEYRRHSAAD